jgi:hypothetical protein
MKSILPIKFMATVEEYFKEVIEFCEENNLVNEQEFLDFLDRMNKLSVSH